MRSDVDLLEHDRDRLGGIELVCKEQCKNVDWYDKHLWQENSSCHRCLNIVTGFIVNLTYCDCER